MARANADQRELRHLRSDRVASSRLRLHRLQKREDCPKRLVRQNALPIGHPLVRPAMCDGEGEHLGQQLRFNDEQQGIYMDSLQYQKADRPVLCMKLRLRRSAELLE